MSIVVVDVPLKEQEPLLDVLELGEKPQEKEIRTTTHKISWIDLNIVFLVALVSEAARGVVMPHLAPYVKSLGGNDALLGYIVSAFSVGRLASTLGLGYLSTIFSYKVVLAGSVVICIIGNLMYSFAHFGSIYLLLASQLVTGFGAGTLSVQRAYVAHVTTPQERTPYLSLLGAVQFFGFAVTPGLGNLISYMPAFHISGITYNNFTFSGYFLAALCIGVLLLVLLQFKNPPSLPPVAASTFSSTPPPSYSHRQQLFILVIFLALNFMVRLVIGIIEGFGSPIYTRLSYNDSFSAGFLFGTLGLAGMCVLLMIYYLSKFISDFKMLVVGLIGLVIGMVLLIGNPSLTRFIFGCAFIWVIGYPFAQTIVVSMFSKMLGGKPQGTWMGWISAMGASGRIVGPTVAGLLLDEMGQSQVFIFGSCFAALALFTSFILTFVRKS